MAPLGLNSMAQHTYATAGLFTRDTFLADQAQYNRITSAIAATNRNAQ
ncbi:MAG TPA: hypothetical protein VFT87_02820 [Candidatus Saccharimonadales bacterium]|nr:hypothetical protein [Candidatus Saccharimonadales bacterium]